MRLRVWQLLLVLNNCFCLYCWKLEWIPNSIMQCYLLFPWKFIRSKVVNVESCHWILKQVQSWSQPIELSEIKDGLQGECLVLWSLCYNHSLYPSTTYNPSIPNSVTLRIQLWVPSFEGSFSYSKTPKTSSFLAHALIANLQVPFA